MPRGRRPGPGTAEEKAAIRRERIRLNVQAFRKRKSGAEPNQSAGNKSKLRWVSDSKWQTEYDETQRHSEETSQDGTNGSSCAAVGTPATSHGSVLADDEDLDLSVMALPKSPDLGKQYSHALLAAFPSRFLPHRVSLPQVPNGYINIRTPCALWVTSACKLAQSQDSGPLKDSLLSIVLAMAGAEQQRPELTITSQRLYTRSLARTRHTIQPIIDNRQIPVRTDLVSVFLACHAASVFEMLVHGSLEDMARHVVGIGLLIQHLQDQSEISGLDSIIGDSLIEEYRMLQMSFSLMHRRPSAPFGKRKRTNVSKAGEAKSTSIFTDILDLVDQVPPVMEEMDKLRAKQLTDPSFCAEQLDTLIPNLLQIHSQLKKWSDILRSKLVEHSLGDIFTPTEIKLNPFGITSYEFAATWIFSSSWDCYTIDTCIEALEFLLSLEPYLEDPTPALTSSRINILRSDLITGAGELVEIMPYFMQDDKGVIGRSIAIWPLECAWTALESEEKRLRREEAELELMGADMELKIKVQEKKVKVMKYLKMCRDVESIVKAYGLPMFKHRQ